jgi:hypothetical protein
VKFLFYKACFYCMIFVATRAGRTLSDSVINSLAAPFFVRR